VAFRSAKCRYWSTNSPERSPILDPPPEVFCAAVSNAPADCVGAVEGCGLSPNSERARSMLATACRAAPSTDMDPSIVCRWPAVGRFFEDWPSQWTGVVPNTCSSGPWLTRGLAGRRHHARDHQRGPIPAAVARGLVSKALGDERSRCTLRRLYRHPKSGQLVAMESRSRRFPKGLAKFIDLPDQMCRTPYCDAPIRHRDGPTSAKNGLGDCERCNYTKEAPGWSVTAGTENGAHTARFETPTGHRYRSTAPSLPGPPHIDKTEMEVRIGIALAEYRAA
jgi:hypothetical protein